MRIMLFTLLMISFNLTASTSVAANDFKGICTITSICSGDKLMHQLYAETRIVDTYITQAPELDFCAEDSHKAQQVVQYFKQKAQKLVEQGICQKIVNHTRY